MRQTAAPFNKTTQHLETKGESTSSPESVPFYIQTHEHLLALDQIPHSLVHLRSLSVHPGISTRKIIIVEEAPVAGTQSECVWQQLCPSTLPFPHHINSPIIYQRRWGNQWNPPQGQLAHRQTHTRTHTRTETPGARCGCREGERSIGNQEKEEKRLQLKCFVVFLKCRKSNLMEAQTTIYMICFVLMISWLCIALFLWG